VKEVHPVDVQEGDSGQITEGFGDTVVFGVDDQGSLAHGVSSVSDLADTGPHLAGFLGFLNIIVSSDGLHQSDSLLGLGEALDAIFDDTGNLRDLVDLVSTGHEEGGEGRRSNSRADGITPHLPVYTSVPFPPRLGGGEHTSRSTHVTVSSLSGPVGTTTSDSRNTGDSATSSP